MDAGSNDSLWCLNDVQLVPRKYTPHHHQPEPLIQIRIQSFMFLLQIVTLPSECCGRDSSDQPAFFQFSVVQFVGSFAVSLQSLVIDSSCQQILLGFLIYLDNKREHGFLFLSLNINKVLTIQQCHRNPHSGVQSIAKMIYSYQFQCAWLTPGWVQNKSAFI